MELVETVVRWQEEALVPNGEPSLGFSVQTTLVTGLLGAFASSRSHRRVGHKNTAVLDVQGRIEHLIRPHRNRGTPHLLSPLLADSAGSVVRQALIVDLINVKSMLRQLLIQV